MTKDFAPFFCPESIAVVGASRSADKLGSIVLRNIIDSGFKGKIYPINPNASDINNLKTYPDVTYLPANVDLAVVAIPAKAVNNVIIQIGEQGIKNVVVISAGFKEAGPEGAKMEADLIKTAEKYGLNLLGPNCLGFVNNLCPLNLTFGQVNNQPGNLRFITQSGAIASSIFDWADATGLGFDEFVTLGNKAVLNENDFLEYFLANPMKESKTVDKELLSDVTPIGLYLESVSDGSRFLQLAKEVALTNPVLVIKPGKTAAAAKAMQSHTGAIAGEDDVFDAVVRQAGIVRCGSLQDFFDFSRAFAWEKLPKGPRIAVVSNAGGPAVITADAVEHEGLVLASFDPETQEELEESLPRAASIMNPVDVLGDALADRYGDATEAILKTEDVDALIVILTPQIVTEIKKTAQLLGKLSRKYKKPIFCSFIGGSLVAEGEKLLNEAKIPSFRFPERAVKAVGAMWRFKNYQNQQKKMVDQKRLEKVVTLQTNEDRIRPALQKAINENFASLESVTVDEILGSIGIKTPATQTAHSIEQAQEFAQINGWPVVLKISAPGLVHKKKAGGVILNIRSEDELANAWENLQTSIGSLSQDLQKRATIQIQQSVENGIEVIVGVKQDPTFGPVLLFGAGGQYAEIVMDKNLAVLPINLSQARELVSCSKIYPLLRDMGESSGILEQLYDLIVRVGKLSTMMPEVSDVEINPVIITASEIWAVDGKIIMKNTQPMNDSTTNSSVATPKKPPTWQKAKTLVHETLASKFNYYEFETSEPLLFEPGQYVNVKAAPDAIRAYSIAGHRGDNIFFLLVDTRPGGPGSQFFESLNPGDEIEFMGPFGVFMLGSISEADELIFMSTGSGTSSIRCMINAVLTEQGYEKPVTFYFGLTKFEEIFWKDHFDGLMEKYPNFKYEIVLFEKDERWNGPTGYNTQLLRDNFTDTSGCIVYLCGFRAMMEEATEILLEKGTPKENIHQERFS